MKRATRPASGIDYRQLDRRAMELMLAEDIGLEAVYKRALDEQTAETAKPCNHIESWK